MLTDLKKHPDYTGLNEVDGIALQLFLRDLHTLEGVYEDDTN